MTDLLVTGGNGFVGAAVVRAALAQKLAVTLVLRPESDLRRLEGLVDRCRVIRAPLADAPRWLSELGPVAPPCLHLAWYAEPGKYLESTRNLDSLTDTLTLLRALETRGCPRFVGAGTCAEYDPTAAPLTEESATRPTTLYGTAKLAAAQTGLAWSERSQVPFVWGRLFNLFGPFEAGGRLVSDLSRALLAGESFAASTGTQLRDYLHVDDVARAFLHLSLTPNARGIYNISSGDPVSVATLLQTTARLAGRPDAVQLGARPARPWDPPFLVGDATRLRALGWQPAFDLERGLTDTLRFWREQPQKEPS